MPEDLHPLALPSHRVWNRGGTRPVLALHCSLAHAGAWSGLVEHLTGVTVTATDAPGHGRAADWLPTQDMHARATAESIAMAETLAEGGPIDLFGHSFGGTVALRIAVERPDLVRSLTLVEPVIFAAAHAAHDPAYAPFRAAHLAFGALVQAGQREEAAALFHAQWGTGDRFADLPDRSRSYMLDRIHLIVAQNAVLLDDAAGILRAGGLEALQAPVLLVDGAVSPPIIEAVQTALAARLRHVKRLTVPGAAHMVSITHAAAVAPAVQAHLDAC